MTSNFTGASPDAEIPKSVISIAVLAGALIIGLIIAKAVNVIYDRQSIRDDASDISDYTRDRLKEQLALVFNKDLIARKRRPEELTRKYYGLWRSNVIRNRLRRARGEEVKPAKRTHGTINEETPTNDRGPSHESEPPATVSTQNEVQTGDRAVPQRQISTTSLISATPVVTVVTPPAPRPYIIARTPAQKETPVVKSPSSKGEPPFATLYAASAGSDTRRKSASLAGKNGSGATVRRDSNISRSAGSLKGKKEDDKKPPARPKSGFKAAAVQPVTAKKTGTAPRPGTAKKR